MVTTSARLLRLLSLLQTRRDWSGAELAERLGVAARTVRRDVERLRGLGYPVHASPGVSGGYRLGAGGAMPPLLLDDEEAVAVAVGLRTAAGGTVTGIDEASVRALAKLEQVLPSRLLHRVRTVYSATVAIGRDGPQVDAEVLAAVASACRGREGLRFSYLSHDGTESLRMVEPHSLVCWSGRWYLLAWDTGRQDWRTFRADRMQLRSPGGPRFTPREVPGGDVATYVARRMRSGMWPVQARILVHAPASRVAGWTMGIVEPVDSGSCVLSLGGETLHMIAVAVGLLDADFDVIEPPELAGHLRDLARRYLRASAPAG